MSRKVLILTSAVGLLLAAAPAASAHRDHPICAAFGDHVSTDAKALHPQGQVVRQFALFINEHVLADHAALCSTQL